MKKIYYLAYYGDRDTENCRNSHPAAELQVLYLVQVLNELGYEVEIVSPSGVGKVKKFLMYSREYTWQIKKGVRVRYFPSLGSRFKIIPILCRYWMTIRKLKQFIKNEIDGTILIYHSTELYPIYHLLNKMGKEFILEVEEIYADFTGGNRELELQEISRASSYVIPTQLLVPKVTGGKPWVLYHGSCFEERDFGRNFRDGRIHIVYAGTLDYRKVGELVAIDVAKYLDNRYYIHILGIGSEEEVEHIKKRIDSMNNLKCKISYDGVLYGEEYLSFLQSCDIGLYTQDSPDVVTSFPSKLMSYLTNGLRIVANKTPVLECSEIKDLICFSEYNEPESVAEAIRRVDFSISYDSRRELQRIHQRLKADLKILLESIEKQKV